MVADYAGMELSTQLLIEEALKRGIRVDILDAADNFIRLQNGGQIEYVKQATRTSLDSYIAPLIMENKEVTKIILREHGINVPAGGTAHSVAEALALHPGFTAPGIVVKPKSTNFGKGITILKGPFTADDYRNAVERAFEYDGAILIEAFIPGREYRFLVIGDQVVAVLHRVPANVTGDGIHTIAELVVLKNQDPLRGKGYVTPLERINLGTVEAAYLQLQGRNFQDIPGSGETVYLRENSNISTGGDSIDSTDTILDGYKTIAVNAARAVGAKICGADIMIRDVTAEPAPQNYCVIELNFNPALHIHNFPYRGKNRGVEKKVLDLLGFHFQDEGAG